MPNYRHSQSYMSNTQDPPPSYSQAHWPSHQRNYGTGGNPYSDEQTPLRITNKHPSLLRLKLILWTLSFLLLASVIWIAVQHNYYESTLDRPEVRDRIRREWVQEETRQRERIAQDDARRRDWIRREDARRRDRIALEDKRRHDAIDREDAARRDRIEREDAERERRFQLRTDTLNQRQHCIDEKEREMRGHEERRNRANLAWVGLTMDVRCLEYNSRQYRAQLANIPLGEDAHRWCMETPIEINGIQYDQPDTCVVEPIQNDSPQVFATWTVRSNEPTCTTTWEGLNDRGCEHPGSNRRIFEAKLSNHQPPWDNWREMCSTTPIRFQGHSYDRPELCDNKGLWGTWGTWRVIDTTC